MPYSRANVDRAKAFVAWVNARTACRDCDKQPVQWHNPTHITENRRQWRIGSLAAHGFPIDVIWDEMMASVPLCARCHMVEDGRLAALPTFPDRRPEATATAKLTWEQVREIRARGQTRARNGAGSRIQRGLLTKLAVEFGVTASAVEKILRNETWKES
jgi:hypothetical protein